MYFGVFWIFGFCWGLTASTEEKSYDFGQRIIGGKNATISEIPYQVSILLSKRKDEPLGIRCGGSIISKNYILSAAHCFEDVCLMRHTLMVRIGSPYWNKEGRLIGVQDILEHPKYNSSTIDYDVAILKLNESIFFNEKSGYISLSDKEPFGPNMVQISGWGTTKPIFYHETSLIQPASVLQVVNTSIIHRNLCQKILQYFPINKCSERIPLTSRMFCVEQELGGGCQGDSGGPVVLNGLQVGIVSWGTVEPEGRCISSPGVMVNIADPEIIGFIREITRM